MALSNAERQAAYRARHKDPPVARPAVRRRADPRDGRIAELEAEVHRLKQLLSGRTLPPTPGSFNSRPFTPVPKVRPSR